MILKLPYLCKTMFRVVTRHWTNMIHASSFLAEILMEEHSWCFFTKTNIPGEFSKPFGPWKLKKESTHSNKSNSLFS